jgi:hypothetical protein
MTFIPRSRAASAARTTLALAHVARAPVSEDLPGEDLLEAVVVPDRGERRGVRVQGDRRPRCALLQEPPGELGCQMLGVGRRPAVAAQEQLPARCKGRSDHARRRDHVRGQGLYVAHGRIVVGDRAADGPFGARGV